MHVALVAGAAALGVAMARTRSRKARRRVSCDAWALPKRVPPNIARRAKEILAEAPDYGTERLEEWDGQLWKFVVETHGPNPENPRPHKGVGVRLCADRT